MSFLSLSDRSSRKETLTLWLDHGAIKQQRMSASSTTDTRQGETSELENMYEMIENYRKSDTLQALRISEGLSVFSQVGIR